jgi:hypothetical protein
MGNFEIIEHKLQQFISKFYRNELIRGLILFAGLGLLYFLVTVTIEYFLWLNPLGRTILFCLFVVMESFLLIRFVGLPLARLFRLSKGIDFRDAGTIIGTHFPEVSDKLINVIQLHKSGGDDDLTWASINQKSEELEPIPFTLAIDYFKNRKYAPYLILPVAVFAVLALTGNDEVITDSAKRVADYSNDYRPPAPFEFKILNRELKTLQNKDFKLLIGVSGRKLPENASIFYNNETYFLQQESLGQFSFVFSKPRVNTEFYIKANEVVSSRYTLQVDDVPVINSLELFLDYPSHTGKTDERVVATGNAFVPQGTSISWRLFTARTTNVDFISNDIRSSFQKTADNFAFAKAAMEPFKYQIAISNNNVQDHEMLNFKIEVVKDEFPELQIVVKKDSINDDIFHYKGEAADDYGIRMLQMVYYPVIEPSRVSNVDLGANGGVFQDFYHTFPGNLDLEPGTAYQYYFEVIDNDAVNNYKSTKSQVFSYRNATQDERNQKQLANQKEAISNIEESLKEQNKQQQNLDDLAKEQFQKKERTFNDKRKLEQALKEQQRQDQFMRQELNKMKENLQNSYPKQDTEKDQLKSRMEKSAEELKRNEELLKELQEYQDKLSPEELKEKIDQTKNKSAQQKRNLEQLVELTKRYYVKQKYELLGKELAKLAVKQKMQSEKDGEENKKNEQDQLNKEYEKWERELNELEKENDDLKKPMDMEFDPDDTDQIKQEQQQSSKDIENKKVDAAKKNQKSAADKMKQQANNMAMQMSQMAQEGEKEDALMLRQILDNLLVFSMEEEGLMLSMKDMNRLSPTLGSKLKSQKELERAFGHVDDSLFALATRNPKIGQDINKEVTDIYYNLNNSLERIAEFDIDQGMVSQQFVFTGANKLADLLSNSLDTMNEDAQLGMGKDGSSGSGFQLPDIIKKQESLAKSGEDGDKGEEGKQGKEGQEGQDGKSGEGGSQGKEGKNGKSGDSGSEGDQGKQGQNGRGEGGENGDDGGNGDDGKEGKEGKDGKFGSNVTGSGNGADGKDGDNPGYKESEQEAKRLYEIYKKQQELRNDLENMIRREGLEQKAGDLVEKMKSVERKLLDQGFNREVQKRMMDIQHDLLKLRDAGLEQGEENQREAATNRKDFKNNTNLLVPDAAKYFYNKEILNRQVLPLQPAFKQKVKEYFKTND